MKRRLLALGATALAALVLQPGAASAAPAGAAAVQPTRSLAVCFTTPPAGWSGIQRASFPKTFVSVAAVAPDGDRAYAYFITEAGGQGIAAVDLGTGALTDLADFPSDSSGIASMAVDDHWLAWVQGDSQFTFHAWSVHALDLRTGQQVTLATSRLPDGSLAVGQEPLLVLQHGVLGWAQPTSSTSTVAEVRTYDLGAGRQSVLDSGRVSSPVYAGHDLVWGRIGADGRTTFRAVDARTHEPVELPERVRNQPGIAYLAGSPDYLVWSTDAHHAAAWRLDDGRLTTYAIDVNDSRNVLQFLTVAGRFLLWPTGVDFAVLDLATGGAFDAPLVGGILIPQYAGSEATIALSTPLGLPATKGGVAGTAVSSLHTEDAPALPGCAG
jgi:hypothetical protein